LPGIGFRQCIRAPASEAGALMGRYARIAAAY
jgi:hypothetical protein